MSAWTENILVGLIVSGAVSYVVRHMWRVLQTPAVNRCSACASCTLPRVVVRFESNTRGFPRCTSPGVAAGSEGDA